MASASPLPALAPQISETARAPSRTVDDPLDGDRLGYNAWLLPPEEIGPTERLVRSASSAAGPALFLVTVAVAVPIIF